MTLEECRKAWKAAGQHGSKEERIALNSKWLKFYSYLAGKEATDEPDAHWQTKEVVETLKAEKILHKDICILDIGAGTGAFSLAFSECCGKVTSMDMDNASLELLARRTEKSSINNLQTVNAMWEDFEPTEKYDVTFSSMCPAICDYDELLKMESITNDTCCILAVARGSYDKHRQKLMREVFKVKPKGGMNSEAIWYYDMLYLMGRQPNVKTFSRDSKSNMPIEYLVERNKVYFEIFGISPKESERKLREYYSEFAKDGMVEDETYINTALIWWKVPSKNH